MITHFEAPYFVYMYFFIISFVTNFLCISCGKIDEIDHNKNETVMMKPAEELERYFSIADPIKVFLFSLSTYTFNVHLPCSCIGGEYVVKMQYDSNLFEINENKSYTIVCNKDQLAQRNTSTVMSFGGVLRDTREILLYGTSLGVSDLRMDVHATSHVKPSSANDYPSVGASLKANVSPVEINNITMDVINSESVPVESRKMKQTPVVFTDVNDTNEKRLNSAETRTDHEADSLEGNCTKVESNETDIIVYSEKIKVLVVKKPRKIDNIFQIVIAINLFLMSVGFGCALDIDNVKKSLKKPIAPGIGFVCQYGIMPMIGFSIAKLLPKSVDRSLPLGIFIMGVCPGGGLSNLYTFLLDGDISLSITMTFVSTIASVGMMPLWIYTLGRQFTDEHFNIKIPYKNLFLIIALVTVPVFIGLFFQYKMKRVARTIVLILKPACLISVFITYALGIYSCLPIFRLSTIPHVLSGCLLPYLGYGFGSAIAAILRQPCKRVKTIALETGMQNAGIAYLLTMTSFPPPHGDLASLAPILSALATPCPPLILSVLYIAWKCYQNKYKPVVTEHQDMVGEPQSL